MTQGTSFCLLSFVAGKRWSCNRRRPVLQTLWVSLTAAIACRIAEVMSLVVPVLSQGSEITELAACVATASSRQRSCFCWGALVLVYVFVLHVLAAVPLIQACCWARRVFVQQASLQPEMVEPEPAVMTGTREEAEEGDARPDLVAELLRFTIPELKVALQTRHKATSGCKSVLAERLSQTVPMASRAQVKYMCDLRRKHSALHIDMLALLSVRAASTWLDNAETVVKHA